ncbi:hypothetical protein PG993_012895 [Apiospora rasikravindrae]|uniref:Ankyrin n=1 Tax=Apiospora rasikravindrae TaxID=990691 RepID=A0ABR1RW80_9PEZI
MDPTSAIPGSHSPFTNEYNPSTLREAVYDQKTIPILRECLDLTRAHAPREYEETRNLVFTDMLQIQELRLIEHMLDNGYMSVSEVEPWFIRQHASKEVVELLLVRGWDINMQDRKSFRDPTETEGGDRLLDYCVREYLPGGNGDLARWLVAEKGATPDGFTGAQDHKEPPPVLNEVAQFGTVSLYKFLEEHGASPSPRVLHLAVDIAASMRVDPSTPDGKEPVSEYNFRNNDDGGSMANRAEMVRFLVEERGLDVNGIDSDVSHAPMKTHFGTPIAYAAGSLHGAKVVAWLLEKGADPTIRGPCWPTQNAYDRARGNQAFEVLTVLHAPEEYFVGLRTVTTLGTKEG